MLIRERRLHQHEVSGPVRDELDRLAHGRLGDGVLGRGVRRPRPCPGPGRRATLDRAAPDNLPSDTALSPRAPAWLEAQHGRNQPVKADDVGWMTSGGNVGDDGSGVRRRAW